MVHRPATMMFALATLAAWLPQARAADLEDAPPPVYERHHRAPLPRVEYGPPIAQYPPLVYPVDQGPQYPPPLYAAPVPVAPEVYPYGYDYPYGAYGAYWGPYGAYGGYRLSRPWPHRAGFYRGPGPRPYVTMHAGGFPPRGMHPIGGYGRPMMMRGPMRHR